jgi:hypothetical protein
VNQVALFHDNICDAIGADIAAAGGYKAVAGKLWPADPSGAAKLRNCLNPDQPHKLCPEELLAIKKLAHESGATAIVDYEAAQLGYQVTWISPEDELERIERENNELLKALLKRQARADELKERAALRAVK